MNKYSNFINMIFFRCVLLLFICIGIYNFSEIDFKTKIIFAVINVLLQANDILRTQILKNKKILYKVSIYVSILVIGFFMYRINTLEINIYYIFPIAEIMVHHKEIPVDTLILHGIVYFLACTFTAHHNINFVDANYFVRNILISYIMSVGLVYLFRNNKLKNDELRKVNGELKTANATLENILRI